MADLNNKINDEALDEVSGGKLNTGLKHLPKSGGSGSMHTSGTTNWRPVRCSVQSGYLARRICMGPLQRHRGLGQLQLYHLALI